MSLIAAIGWKLVDRIGPFSPHGLGIAVGYVAGGSLGAARAERLYGIKKDHIWNALMWAVVGVIIGSRLFYIAGHLEDYFFDDILGIFRIWEGGIVFYGGAIGGIVAGIPYLRRTGIPIWHGLDSIAPGFPLGIIIGRVGDLVIGDHLGGPTSFFLGYRYQGGADPPGCLDGRSFSPTVSCPAIGDVVHQTALYDLLSVLIIFPVVLWVARYRRPDGFLFMFMASWYALGRLLSDFGRPAATYAGLRGTQWVSVAIIVYGIWRIARVGGSRLQPIPIQIETDEQRAAEMIHEGSPAPDHTPDLPPEGSDEARMVDEGSPIASAPSHDGPPPAGANGLLQTDPGDQNAP